MRGKWNTDAWTSKQNTIARDTLPAFSRCGIRREMPTAKSEAAKRNAIYRRRQRYGYLSVRGLTEMMLGVTADMARFQTCWSEKSEDSEIWR